MPLTNSYGTLAGLKLRLKIDSADTTYDDQLTDYLNGASRLIDGWCGRRFYTTAADETRLFTPFEEKRLFVPDLVSLTTLKTDEDGDRTFEVTWTSTRDYYLTPDNASLDGEPYRAIEVDRPNGWYLFPRRHRSTQIVGKFGWSAVPAAIQEACYRVGVRLWTQRKMALGEGAEGSDLRHVLLEQTRLERDVIDMIQPYRVPIGFA